MPTEYARALGGRLRAIRTQQGLSLHGVEEKSAGRWKAVVVGSYERGDRAVTVQRLAELLLDGGGVLPEGLTVEDLGEAGVTEGLDAAAEVERARELVRRLGEARRPGQRQVAQRPVGPGDLGEHGDGFVGRAERLGRPQPGQLVVVRSVLGRGIVGRAVLGRRRGRRAVGGRRPGGGNLGGRGVGARRARRRDARTRRPGGRRGGPSAPG